MSELNNNILGDNIETKAIDNDIVLGACTTDSIIANFLYYIHILKLDIKTETINNRTYNISTVLSLNSSEKNICIKTNGNIDTTQTLDKSGSYYYYYPKLGGSPSVGRINMDLMDTGHTQITIPSPTNIDLYIPGHYTNSFTQNWYTITGDTSTKVSNELFSILNGLSTPTSLNISTVNAYVNTYTITNGKTAGALSPLRIYFQEPDDGNGITFDYYSYTNDGTTYYPAQQIKLKCPYDYVEAVEIYRFGGGNISNTTIISLAGLNNGSSINLDNYISSSATTISSATKVLTTNEIKARFSTYPLSNIVKDTNLNRCLAGNNSLNENNFFGFYTTVTNQNMLLRPNDLKGIKGTSNVEKLGIKYNEVRTMYITPVYSYAQPTGEPSSFTFNATNLSPKYTLRLLRVDENGSKNTIVVSSDSSNNITIPNTNAKFYFNYDNYGYNYTSYSCLVTVYESEIEYDSDKGYYDSCSYDKHLMDPQDNFLESNINWELSYDDIVNLAIRNNGNVYFHNFTNMMYTDVDFELLDDFSDYPLVITLYYQGNYVDDEYIQLTEIGDCDYVYMEEYNNFYDYEVYFNSPVQLLDQDGNLLGEDGQMSYYVSDIRPYNTIYIKKPW